MTAVLVGISLSVSSLPGCAEWLQYDRVAFGDGQFWRPLTSQLVHWSPKMTLLDLGVLLVTGAWIEIHARRLLAGCVTLSAAMVAAGMHFLDTDLMFYRGSSGIATASFTALALLILFDPLRGKWLRRLGLTAILLLGTKLILESRQGTVIAAGHLPDGIQVAGLAHQLGALAGVVSGSVYLRQQRRGRAHSTGP